MQTQFIILLLVASVICLSLFNLLWTKRWNVWNFSTKYLHTVTEPNTPEFWEKLRVEALKYDVPKSEKDKKAIKNLEPFFDLFDDYTSVTIYDSDGYYLTGKNAQYGSMFVLSHLGELGYLLVDSETAEPSSVPIHFRNNDAHVMFQFYHRNDFASTYFLTTLFACVTLFLSIIIFFINRKMKTAIALKDDILQMASGNLTHPIPTCGNDEIGILAQELDHLRIALNENIQQEQESRQANHDLITAMSHDLRTPLTILKGYLEIIKLNRSPDMQNQYIERCIEKTNDIQLMTNRMFEYSLVFDETEVPDLIQIPNSFFYQCLTENCDFLQLAGFHPMLDFSVSDQTFLGDETILKRIFNNIFSNILKYGDKKETVAITGNLQNQHLQITLSNSVKQNFAGIESNKIGLKSVAKMMKMLHGEINVSEENKQFIVKLTFPII